MEELQQGESMSRVQRLRLNRGVCRPALLCAASAVLVAALAAADRALAATTLIVGPPSCAGASYTTIQSAVDAASPGDTVQVCPGTYPEQVAISATKTGL